MKLYLKQKVFSLRDKFNIYDEAENPIFTVEGETFTLGKKLHVYKEEEEVAYIHQKLWSFLPHFYVDMVNGDQFDVQQEVSFLHPKYTVTGLNWNVEGDFVQHEYEVFKGDQLIANISKKWFTWGDTYELNVESVGDVLHVLCIVLVIDAIIDEQETAAASAASN